MAQFSFSNHLSDLFKPNIYKFLDTKLIKQFWPYRKGNIDEYSMIEFQGDLETKSEEALGNKVIGDLHFNHEVTSR